MYYENVKFLEEELAICKKLNKKSIVLTHHAPLIKNTSHPQYEEILDRPENEAYGSDLSRLLMSDMYPFAWLFGHTHFNTCFHVNKTLVASNCRGYPNEIARFSNKLLNF
jgi:Icc-related predicted phosphoesterase